MLSGHYFNTKSNGFNLGHLDNSILYVITMCNAITTNYNHSTAITHITTPTIHVYWTISLTRRYSAILNIIVHAH